MERNKKHTAAWRLFKLKYKMRIPQAFMYSQKYIEEQGYYISGNAELDQARLMEPSTMNHCVAALAMFHAEGAQIDLVNIADASPIYEDIQEHLRNWEVETTGLIHVEDVPPLEDFRQLEAVAMALHETAIHHNPAPQTDGLQERLMAMNRRRNPRRAQQVQREKITDRHGNIKAYVSIVDRIEKNLIEASKWQ